MKSKIKPIIWFVAAVLAVGGVLAGFVTMTVTLKREERFESKVEHETRVLIPHLVRVQWYKARGVIVPCTNGDEIKARVLAFDEIWSPLWDAVDEFEAAETREQMRPIECNIRELVRKLSPEHLVFAPSLEKLDCQ